MKSIKFKGNKLTARKAVSNILAVYSQCQEEELLDWYGQAHYFAQGLSDSTGYSMPIVCGVIASLSPLNNWDKNKEDARKALNGEPFNHTNTFKGKSRDIMNLLDLPDLEIRVADILKGNKITAFYLNILHPKNSNVLTIDRHTISILLGYNASQREQALTTNQYRFFELCFTMAANAVGVAPIQMQSSTWEAWRRLKTQQNI